MKILRAAAVAVLLVLAAATATKYWVAPHMLRLRLSAVCSQYWRGSVRIGSVDFSFFGPARLRGLELLDECGRQHLWADEATVRLKNRLSDRPTVTSIAARGVSVNFHRVGGKLVFPLRLPPQGDELIEHCLDLQSIQLRDLSVKLLEDRRVSWQLSRPMVTVTRGAKSYEVELPDQEVIDGLRITPLHGNGGQVLAGLEFEAAVLGGKASGKVAIERPSGKSAKCDGFVSISGLDLERLSEFLPTQQSLGVGILTGWLEFHSREPDLTRLMGAGELTVTDVDAEAGPLTGSLLEFLNGNFSQDAAKSNVEAAFTFDRAVATLQDCTLSDALRIMRVESGGTIDLRTGELDLYLVTLQLRGVSKLLTRIPVLKLAATLSNKLTRVHVTGTWHDQIISKEPVEDMYSATLELLQEIVTTGGAIRPVVQDALADLLRTVKDAVAGPATTTSAPAEDP